MRKLITIPILLGFVLFSSFSAYGSDTYDVTKFYLDNGIHFTSAQAACDSWEKRRGPGYCPGPASETSLTFTCTYSLNCTGSPQPDGPYPIGFSCPNGGTVDSTYTKCVVNTACPTGQNRNPVSGVCQTPPQCKIAEDYNIVLNQCIAPLCTPPQINDAITGACIDPPEKICAETHASFTDKQGVEQKCDYKVSVASNQACPEDAKAKDNCYIQLCPDGTQKFGVAGDLSTCPVPPTPPTPPDPPPPPTPPDPPPPPTPPDPPPPTPPDPPPPTPPDPPPPPVPPYPPTTTTTTTEQPPTTTTTTTGQPPTTTTTTTGQPPTTTTTTTGQPPTTTTTTTEQPPTTTTTTTGEPPTTTTTTTGEPPTTTTTTTGQPPTTTTTTDTKPTSCPIGQHIDMFGDCVPDDCQPGYYDSMPDVPGMQCALIPPDCPAGFISDGNGGCIQNECPPGQVDLYPDRLGAQCGTPPPDPQPPTPVVCTNGLVSDGNGGCTQPKPNPVVCTGGLVSDGNGGCTQPKPNPVVCTGGLVSDGNGGCKQPAPIPSTPSINTDGLATEATSRAILDQLQKKDATTVPGNSTAGTGSGSILGTFEARGKNTNPDLGTWYTPSDKTYQTILQDRVTQIKNTPIMRFGQDIFNVDIPGGSCPIWTIPGVMGMHDIPVNALCSEAAEVMWPVVSAVLKILAVFMAFRIAISAF